MKAETDKRGNREQTFYDFAGRADRAIQKDGAEIDFDPVQVQGLYRPEETLDPLNAPVAFQLSDDPESTYVDANGDTITYVLDQAGQTCAAADQEGALPTVQRNENNLVERSTNARGNVTAFEYDGNGNVLSIADEISTSSTLVSTSSGQIGSINNLSGEFTSLATGAVLSDIASSQTGQVFGISSFSNNGELYSVNLETGSFQSIGNLGVSGIDSLAFDPDGVLYGASGSDFYTIDTVTGVASQVADLGDPFTSSGDLVFDREQNLFWATSNTPDADTLFSITLDGIATEVGNIGFDEVYGISIDLQGNLIGYTSDRQQLAIDRETGAGTVQQSVTGLSSSIFGSAEFATGAIPRRFTYDPIFNQVTSITDELGRQTLFKIDDSNGNLLSSTQVIGDVGGTDDLVTQYTYTSQGLVDLVTDPLGRVTDYDYDGVGLLESITLAKGTTDEATQTFEYDAAGNQTAVIDENNNRTEFRYDDLNRLSRIIEADPDGDGPLEAPETTFTYDEAGNLETTTDAADSVITNQYDALDRLKETTDALDHKTLFGYDNLGNLTAITDPLNQTPQNIYDSRNRLTEPIDPEGNITFFDYDLDNNLTSVSETVEKPELLFFEDFESDLNQWTGKNDGPTSGVIVDDPLQEDRALSFAGLDSGGDLFTKESFAQTDRTYRLSFEYLGLPIEGSIESDMGGFAGYSPNDLRGVGTQWLMGTSRNSSGLRPEFQEIDTVGRWDSVVVEFSETNDLHLIFEDFSFSRGVSGDIYFDNIKLEAINTPEALTTFEFDSRSRVSSETDQLGKTIRYDYDGVDNLIVQTDRNERRIEYTYDDIDRLIKEDWIDNSQEIDYAYDKASNLRTVTDNFSALAFTYDNRDRILTVDNADTPGVPNVQLTYAYDDVGNILSTTDTIDSSTGGTNAYSYDALNRLSTLTQSGNQVSDKRVDFTYNNLGQFSTMNRYADLDGTQLVNSSTYDYDVLNRIDRIGHSNGTADIAFYEFEYDEDSRIRQLTDIDGTTNYTYDDRDQLTGANHSDDKNPDETYAYDSDGNRISSSLHTDGYVTEKGNRLTSDGTYTYDYDDEGNLIQELEIATGAIREFEWDYRNRLMAVIDKSAIGEEAQRVTFTYDVFDRRISKTIDSDGEGSSEQVSYFVYDGEDVLLDFVDTDGVVGTDEPLLFKRYLHGPAVDQVLAQESPDSTVEWHLADH